jgi:hypothetical protein
MRSVARYATESRQESADAPAISVIAKLAKRSSRIIGFAGLKTSVWPTV